MEPERQSDRSPSPLAVRLRRTAALVRVLTPREIRLRYRENVLDIAWALITPIAIMAVYGVVLTQSFDVTGSCAPYLATAWTGLVPWTFFASGMGVAVWSLVTSSGLLAKIYFPREAIPLSVVGAALVDLQIGILTVLGVAIFQGVDPQLASLGIFPSLAVLIVWTAALGVLSSAVAVFVRDVTQVVQLGLRVGFFATPVMYEPNLLPSAFAWTASVNPLAVAIEGIRDSLLCGTWPRWGLLFVHLCVGLALLLGSVLYMRSVESRMADVL